MPWWDRTKLLKNNPLDRQIQEALERTACLVIVMSPGFFQSPWCPKELAAFRAAIQKQGRHDSRVFVVDAGHVSDQQRIAAFPNYLAFDFTVTDQFRTRRRLGSPEPNGKDHPGFYDAVNDLAGQIKVELDAINQDGLSWKGTVAAPSTALPPPSASTAPMREVIYVAESSEDLKLDRQQLVAFLESHQFRVVCGGRNVGKFKAWKTAVTRELSSATCFVQLLGLYSGRDIQGTSTSLVQLQYELATEQKKKILQWRAPGLLNQAFSDPLHQQMVSTASAIECTLEEFKHEVKRIATPAPPPKVIERPTIPGDELLPMVFIQAGVEDQSQADRLSELLSSLNCFACIPMTDGPPDKIREDVEANLAECDGLILFYGKTAPDWVRSQFRALPRTLSMRQKLTPPRPLKALAICNGEPPGKPPPGIKAPPGLLEWIDLSVDTHREQLSRWVATLRNGGAL